MRTGSGRAGRERASRGGRVPSRCRCSDNADGSGATGGSAGVMGAAGAVRRGKGGPRGAGVPAGIKIACLARGGRRHWAQCVALGPVCGSVWGGPLRFTVRLRAGESPLRRASERAQMPPSAPRVA